MYSLTYFAEWATPKKWSKNWADVNSLPTQLSANLRVDTLSCNQLL